MGQLNQLQGEETKIAQSEVEEEKEDGKMGDKVIITGDDVLIEYTERLMNALKQINEVTLKVSWRTNIEKFVSHYVWHSVDKNQLVNG